MHAHRCTLIPFFVFRPKARFNHKQCSSPVQGTKPPSLLPNEYCAAIGAKVAATCPFLVLGECCSGELNVILGLLASIYVQVGAGDGYLPLD